MLCNSRGTEEWEQLVEPVNLPRAAVVRSGEIAHLGVKTHPTTLLLCCTSIRMIYEHCCCCYQICSIISCSITEEKIIKHT